MVQNWTIPLSARVQQPVRNFAQSFAVGHQQFGQRIVQTWTVPMSSISSWVAVGDSGKTAPLRTQGASFLPLTWLAAAP